MAQAKFNPVMQSINPRNYITILLVEDNPADIIIFERKLKHLGSEIFEITTVPKMSEAFAIIEDDQFDVIILDLNLADMDGVTTVAALHEKAPEIPVIVHSGNLDHSLARQAYMCGAKNYLIKGMANAQTIQSAIYEVIINS